MVAAFLADAMVEYVAEMMRGGGWSRRAMVAAFPADGPVEYVATGEIG